MILIIHHYTGATFIIHPKTGTILIIHHYTGATFIVHPKNGTMLIIHLKTGMIFIIRHKTGMFIIHTKTGTTFIIHPYIGSIFIIQWNLLVTTSTRTDLKCRYTEVVVRGRSLFYRPLLSNTYIILPSYLFGQPCIFGLSGNDVIGEPAHVLIPRIFTLQYFKSQQIKENAK